MDNLQIGSNIPTMDLESTQGTIQLNQFKDKHIVLYFYPKDNTSGCSQQAQDFRDNIDNFAKLETIILGVSRDSLESHEKFIAKFELPFTLISDPDEKLCKLFDVIKMKSMYGRQYLGIERSTFLIDPQGKLTQEWRKVKVKDHVKTVLKTIETLTTSCV